MLGWYRSYDFEKQVPNFQCIKDSLASSDNVTSVSYRIDVGGKPLTLHGIEKPNQLHRFFYKLNGVSNNFYFNVNYLNETSYSHGVAATENQEAEKLVNIFKPFILKFESKIEAKCNFTLPNTIIRTTCDIESCK